VWFQLQIEDCASSLVESLSEFLENGGALSIMLQDQQDNPVLEPLPGTTPLWPQVVVQALFLEKDQAEEAAQQLLQLYPKLRTRISLLADRDWERECIQDFKPQQFGERLWVCPTWLSPPDPKAVTLMLDPGLSFGTGTHPTTALCLRWLSSAPLQNQSLIDYGCGSGILSLAAMKLGASPVYAVDIDHQALEATSNNAKSNHLDTTQLCISQPEALHKPVDCILANILLGPLISLKDRFAALMKPGAQLVVSGILKSQATLLQEAYQDSFRMVQQQTEEDWCLLVFTV